MQGRRLNVIRVVVIGSSLANTFVVVVVVPVVAAAFFFLSAPPSGGVDHVDVTLLIGHDRVVGMGGSTSSTSVERHGGDSAFVVPEGNERQRYDGLLRAIHCRFPTEQPVPQTLRWWW